MSQNSRSVKNVVSEILEPGGSFFFGKLGGCARLAALRFFKRVKLRGVVLD